MAANTPETIFAPGSNPNGAILAHASFFASFVSDSIAALQIGTSAPATWAAGFSIMEIACLPTGSGNLNESLFIPAGFGLYYIAAQNELSSKRSVGYTLL